MRLCTHTSSSTHLFVGTWVVSTWEIPGFGRSEEGNSNPLQYSCLESHGQRSLVGYSPWGCKELNLTERLTHTGCFHVFSSVAQSCPTLQPMDCSMPGFPVHNQLLELAQTHVGDVIQPSHSLVIPFPSCLQSFSASRSFQ